MKREHEEEKVLKKERHERTGSRQKGEEAFRLEIIGVRRSEQSVTFIIDAGLRRIFTTAGTRIIAVVRSALGGS